MSPRAQSGRPTAKYRRKPDHLQKEIQGQFDALRGYGPDAEWIDSTPTSFQSSGELLQRLLAGLHLEERVSQHHLHALWPQIVGPFNAQFSQVDSLKNGTLVVRVSNSPLLHQLRLMKSQWLKKLNAIPDIPPIRDIRFSP
jgi:predicted nucleic acid-binding Zn ribbon protein